MSTNLIPADVAMLHVLESWRVKDLFGYPAGSLNSLMNALNYEHQRINFIQVRHEQVGALAASAQAKLTHHIGVAFGSAGPGAVNMLNGLYDAKEDHVPVLAIVGQANSDNLNYDYFQEFPEAPIFSNVACYDRIVMNAQSLPHVVDRAIREAYQHQSVAVVIIPNDLGFVKIPDRKYSSAPHTIVKPSYPKIFPQIINQFLKMVKQAKHPVFHVGKQIGDSGKLLVKLSQQLQIPIMIDGTAKGLIPGEVTDLGTGNRITSKVANELMDTTDLVISLGSEFALSHRYYDKHPFKFIQVDRRQNCLGYHHPLDLGIWADPTEFIKAVLKTSVHTIHQLYYSSVIKDIQNENQYRHHLAIKKTNPILPTQVYHQINRIANDKTIFSVDIGDNTVNSFRYLKMGTNNQLVFSAHFATMGCSIPGAIAAKLSYPHRQVFSIAGDGAFSMVMQDLVTERKYHLPIINGVTSNNSTSYIKSQQADLSMKYFGVKLTGQDFAMIAKGMGVKAITITQFSQLAHTFDLAKRVTQNGQPILLNIVISDQRALPMKKLHIHKQNGKFIEVCDNQSDLHQFFAKYNGKSLKSLPELLAQVAKQRH
ncbi:pyruvate oxidase [Acetilactobacillus jinshanensis]|uniref:Pyruvate oxidase n=1 Tax=Acetilactobacillus jinshanensis TaxID=1720083 RepID=A0A4P6ZL07_9LACO|nr:pyruvate oxidase [Acetilactobacillus jinshanensis]QBP18505.1 pyruvate oxidase [Acetilactobacillus jinshanensis]URL61376.1 pyruvate oxidase [uncultured bacterium]